MSIDELMDICLELAEHDCYTEEQFKFRDAMYQIMDILKKYKEEHA